MMWLLARKAILGVVIAALAFANGFAPKHAHATGGGHAVLVQHSHDGHDHAHHHMASNEHEKVEAGLSCQEDAALTVAPGVPASNCCVASCAAIALIFASFELPDSLSIGILVPWTSDSVVLAARAFNDPPPR